MKDLDDINPFNISGVDGGKESKQGNGGVEVTTVVTYKNPFVVNRKLVTVSLALGEGVACNTIFASRFLQAIKASMITKNNDLVSGLLGENFRPKMIVPQIDKEAPKESEGLPVSLTVKIQGKQDNMKDRGIRNITVEQKKTVINRHLIPCQHRSAGRSPSKNIEEGKTMDTDRKENYWRIKDKVVLPIGRVEATKPENMEDLYASLQSRGTEEEDNIPLPY